MDYTNRRKNFFNQANLNDGNTSKIWSTLRKDYQKESSHLRGYGLSTIVISRRNLYIKLSNILAFPFKGVSYVLNRLQKILNKTLSWVLLRGDSDAAYKYGFDTYPAKIYDKKNLDEYLKRYSKYGIGFSHMTFKTFTYLENLKKNVKLERNIKIFEIGAGAFNFGHLLSLELQSFEYVVCDLPEMIIQAHKELTGLYIPKCGGDYEVFLPNEQEEFNNSKVTRKVLFITPEQLHNGILGKQRQFDLFINHESFGEMNIETVNKYLSHLPNLMKVGSIVNLVNRQSRPQARSYDDFSKLELDDITCFEEYNLDFCNVIIKENDRFRSKIPRFQRNPNVFFIGKVK
jgi:putative sugar O-methyltransferase